MAEKIITGVDFVSLPTRNFEVALTFYGETLGLKRTRYRPERNFAEFQAGNLTLNITNAEKMGLEHHANQNAIALRVADMDAARRDFAKRGVKFKGDVFDTGVCYMSFFADPDGNALMLHHRYAP